MAGPTEEVASFLSVPRPTAPPPWLAQLLLPPLLSVRAQAWPPAAPAVPAQVRLRLQGQLRRHIPRALFPIAPSLWCHIILCLHFAHIHTVLAIMGWRYIQPTSLANASGTDIMSDSSVSTTALDMVPSPKLAFHKC